MNQMVTRCPKCATAFRITSTQLDSAQGSVRCGSCLHIFKATEHLVKAASTTTSATDTPTPDASKSTTQTPAPALAKPLASITEKAKTDNQPTTKSQTPSGTIAPKPTPTVAPEKPTQPTTLAKAATSDVKPGIAKPTAGTEKPAVKPIIDKAKILADEEDELISDDMDKVREKSSAYEFDGFMDVDLHPKQTVSLFEREIRYTEIKEPEEVADESWADELLDDEDDRTQRFKKTTQAVDNNTRLEEQSLSEFESTYIEPNETEKPSTYGGPVFSLVSDTNEHSNDEESIFSKEFINATQDNDDSVTAESTSFAAALFEQTDDEVADASTTKRAVKSSSKHRGGEISRAALLMNIIPAPVEFTAKRMRRWYQKKLWPTLATITSITLFFQIAYFKFDYFSRVEPYRTLYVFACPVLNCKVPALIDTKQIHATNLIVRNHPDIEHALMVDAILINNAPFEQPFPDLVLAFSTMDETPVASRRFTPKEYLGGELVGMEHIPERQPVHITLELADPGPDAVNYHLSIP